MLLMEELLDFILIHGDKVTYKGSTDYHLKSMKYVYTYQW